MKAYVLILLPAGDTIPLPVDSVDTTTIYNVGQIIFIEVIRGVLHYYYTLSSMK